MFGVRASSASTRECWAVVLALLLAMRVLASSGLMPAWSAGQLSLVACDGAGAAGLSVGAHRDQEPEEGTRDEEGAACPYAVASAQPWIGAEPVAVGGTTSAPFLKPLEATSQGAQARGPNRPPSTGPPVAA